ncbi:hypothetical protein SAMN05216218_1036 [Halorientalis regularis]|uniref:Uncharacterized protein n=1 Tax=Halorientalis regularis TaxID=660518 RepID=A0A1G7HG77_9EURY|nr:hypothetical protein SAMN05216218_1036 [Halorientalis regularis]
MWSEGHLQSSEQQRTLINRDVLWVPICSRYVPCRVPLRWGNLDRSIPVGDRRSSVIAEETPEFVESVRGIGTIHGTEARPNVPHDVNWT